MKSAKELKVEMMGIWFLIMVILRERERKKSARSKIRLFLLLQECSKSEQGKSDQSVDQMRQNLLRTTLAKQTLEVEKKEMLRKIDELEGSLNRIKADNGEKEKQLRSHQLHIEEFVKKHGSQKDLVINELKN